MNTLQLSIVHRLPQSYRWSAGFAGSKVEPIPQNGAGSDNCLVALKLLSPSDENAWRVMERLSQALTDIEVDSSVLECEGEHGRTDGKEEQGEDAEGEAREHRLMKRQGKAKESL